MRYIKNLNPTTIKNEKGICVKKVKIKCLYLRCLKYFERKNEHHQLSITFTNTGEKDFARVLEKLKVEVEILKKLDSCHYLHFEKRGVKKRSLGVDLKDGKVPNVRLNTPDSVLKLLVLNGLT